MITFISQKFHDLNQNLKKKHNQMLLRFGLLHPILYLLRNIQAEKIEKLFCKSLKYIL